MANSFIGNTIGNYRILEEIGRGGMGVVYRAVHIVNNHKIAIKVLKKELAEDKDFVSRFLREGRLTASLHHPNLVRVYEAGHYAGRYVLAMKYIEGRTVSEIVDERGPLPVRCALGIIRQVALGLGHAHCHGIIHRDIKPDNILVTRKGHAYVTDFGLAKIFQSRTPITSVGTLLGTPGYMAPEQWRSEKVTPRTDIFSMGTVLYEMLTGRPAFPSKAPAKMMHDVLEGDFPAAAPLNRNVTWDIEQILLGMVAKDPTQRYPTAEAVAQDIESYMMHGRLTGKGPANFTFELQDDTIHGIVHGSEDGPFGLGRRRRRRWLAVSPVPLLLLFMVVPLLSAGVVSGRIELGAVRDFANGVTGRDEIAAEAPALDTRLDALSDRPMRRRVIAVSREKLLALLDRQIHSAPDAARQAGRDEGRHVSADSVLRAFPESRQWAAGHHSRIVDFAGQPINGRASLTETMARVRSEVESGERDSIEMTLKRPDTDGSFRVVLDFNSSL